MKCRGPVKSFQSLWLFSVVADWGGTRYSRRPNRDIFQNMIPWCTFPMSSVIEPSGMLPRSSSQLEVLTFSFCRLLRTKELHLASSWDLGWSVKTYLPIHNLKIALKWCENLNWEAMIRYLPTYLGTYLYLPTYPATITTKQTTTCQEESPNGVPITKPRAAIMATHYY